MSNATTPHTASTDSESETNAPTFRRQVVVVLRELFIPDIPDEATSIQRWERRVEGPMFLAALLFLVLYAATALTTGESLGSRIAWIGMWIVWAAFLVDYLVRLALTERRWHWFWTHWWELILIVLPMFRPLRVLRILPTLVILQRFSSANPRVGVALYSSAASLLVVLVAAVTIFDAEAAVPETALHDFGDALWWAITTVTTVGYGDIAPVSPQGRIVAAVLMLSGIALVGVVTAMVSSWLVEQVQNTTHDVEVALDDKRHAELMDVVAGLRTEINALRSEVADLKANRREQD